jgi:hypothetical protein
VMAESCAGQNEVGAGLGPNDQNRAVMARFWAGFGLQIDMWDVLCVLYPNSSNLRGGEQLGVSH